MKKLFFILLILLNTNNLYAVGKKPCLDPFSTINWGYFFDGLLIGNYGDGDGNPLCFCDTTSDGTSDAGIKIRLVEPIGFLELVDTPYKFTCFEGDSGKGGIAKLKLRGTPEEYRNGHYYQYPVFALLNFGMDQLCISDEFPLDLPFIGEMNPLWYDDFTAALASPIALLAGNPIAQLACLWDCGTSTMQQPTEYLSWCNGCWQSRMLGTGKPLEGNPPQSDAALAVSMLDWWHAGYMLPQTIAVPPTAVPFSDGAVLKSANTVACGKSINYFPKVIKNQYLLQTAYPTSTDEMISLGESSMKWSTFKQLPVYQDRIYVLWRKKICCVGVSNLLN